MRNTLEEGLQELFTELTKDGYINDDLVTRFEIEGRINQLVMDYSLEPVDPTDVDELLSLIEDASSTASNLSSELDDLANKLHPRVKVKQ